MCSCVFVLCLSLQCFDGLCVHLCVNVYCVWASIRVVQHVETISCEINRRSRVQDKNIHYSYTNQNAAIPFVYVWLSVSIRRHHTAIERQINRISIEKCQINSVMVSVSRDVMTTMHKNNSRNELKISDFCCCRSLLLQSICGCVAVLCAVRYVSSGLFACEW